MTLKYGDGWKDPWPNLTSWNEVGITSGRYVSKADEAFVFGDFTLMTWLPPDVVVTDMIYSLGPGLTGAGNIAFDIFLAVFDKLGVDGITPVAQHALMEASQNTFPAATGGIARMGRHILGGNSDDRFVALPYPTLIILWNLASIIPAPNAGVTIGVDVMFRLANKDDY